MQPSDVVITGIGLVSPIGIGRADFCRALGEGRSGIGRIAALDAMGPRGQIGGEVHGFDPRRYVANRKGLKLMSRDAQMALAATRLAWQEAGLALGRADPERVGVVLGADRIYHDLHNTADIYRTCLVDGRFDFSLWGTRAYAATYPLDLLRMLPNMAASHISIEYDARGPNNSLHGGELSGLQAVIEAAAVIQRGTADVMIAGGTSSQMTPVDFMHRMAIGCVATAVDGPNSGDPTAVMRPFDARRSGPVWGEAAAVFILEERRHALARGATALGLLRGWASGYAAAAGRFPPAQCALRPVMRRALASSGLTPGDLQHVNAHGRSGPCEDRLEAEAIVDVVGQTPVTSPTSFFGVTGAASGPLEMAVSVLALAAGEVPFTLNYEDADPACPVAVVCREPRPSRATSAMTVNWGTAGQAVAVVVGRDDL